MKENRRAVGGRAVVGSVVACLIVASLAFAFAQRQFNRQRRAAAGQQRILKAGDDLQDALDSARPGDIIVLEAGATFRGPFTLPAKPGDGFITIQSSALAQLPAEGKRVTPADARLMPKLVAPGKNAPALRTAPGAHHYRFVGVEFKPSDASAAVTNLIELGDGSGAQNSLEKVPHHIVIDRCYIHGDPAGTLRRGIALNSAHTEIVNSYISECKTKGSESQAILGWNGPGPFRIVNNYLEGAGENVMFGGNDPSIQNLVPSDIEVLGNHFSKPLGWRGVWTVKNIFELKNARRVRVEGNLFENCWADGQVGIAILFTVRNQDGTAPWSTVEDVTFVNNVVRHAGGGINILGRDDLQPSQQTKRVRVVNNLFEDINGERWGGRGAFLLITEAAEVEFTHNAVFQSQHIMLAYGSPSTGFVFRDNVVMHNEYGVFGDGVGVGAPALAKYFPGAIFSGNLIIGDPERTSSYPAKNLFAITLNVAGFVNPASGDYRLAPGSRFKSRASDGTDPGPNFEALRTALHANEGTYNPHAQGT